jgi:hypothetical protein
MSKINEIERIAFLSGVNYTIEKKQVFIKKELPKVKLIETVEYKDKIKKVIPTLIDDSDKDSQIVEKDGNDAIGEITLIITKDSISETKYNAQEIAYEIKENKQFYKDMIDIKEISFGKDVKINELFVGIENDNVIIKVYYYTTVEDKKEKSELGEYLKKL